VGGFEHAETKLTIAVLEFSFDVKIGRAAVPQNFDVKHGRAAAGRKFHFIIISVSRSHSLTHSPSSGTLWGRKQPVAETSP
jgi:hypothetical protein